MKKLSFIAMFLLLAGLLQAQAQQQVLPPLISVNGVGEVKLQPDEVVINLGVEMREKTLDQARKQADNKAAAIIAYLRKQGVDARDIQTSYMNLQPIYMSGEFGKASPDFYMAQKNMVIVIKKLNKFDELLSGLYDNGVNRIDGIHFRVSDLEKHKVEARKRAVADAKQKANALTSELGAKVGKVYSIHESTMGNGPRPVYAKSAMMMEADMAQGGGPSIAGGEVVVTSNVSVSFVIEQ
ncbi:SIMPL domain-containing protein [Pontibacter sp. JH31]|uniref:SIMPL domain-containing protein n=1 Tax=Pontibacter aquaedesilientis TaxID=2766980 RepID=A0ABR7XHD0_9BACT|nr:SIMPL domain-containing protein [Pontibacter aquaedesilientis]MBD1397674.1 SIMPL domain-containing protein [Pontibacter aquaedesilientis]